MRVKTLLAFWALLIAAMAANAVDTLVPLGASWHWRLGTDEPGGPGAWREADFDEAADWSVTAAPFHRSALAGTRVPNGDGAWMGRMTFRLDNPWKYSLYRLTGIMGGGVVMWLNGVEVFRDGVAAGKDSPTDPPLAGNGALRTKSVVSKPWDLPTLRAGTNVIAVLVLPGGPTSALYWNLRMEAEPDLEAPAITEVRPAAGASVGALDVIEVLFTEPVIGVDASDLLVNGVAAVAVTPLGPDHYAFVPPPLTDANVRVAFRGDAGITDRATSPNVFGGALWSYTVQDLDEASEVTLSEVMTDNGGTLRDEDGDTPDWIELHNPTSKDVRLAGWVLTDDVAVKDKWRFPDVVLAARSFLVVYASGKDRTNVTGRLHTNFRLDADGEYLGLADATGRWVSEFAPRIPKLGKDTSYGRVTGVPEVAGNLDKPTPGAANASAGAGYAPAVTFSRPSGTYPAGTIRVSLSLGSDDTNAVIRYTTNNTVPVALSPRYVGPLEFMTAVHVRARAFSPGKLPGPIASATYTPLSAGMAQVRSDLPLLLIHDYGKGRPSTTGVFATVQVYEPVDGVTTLTNEPTVSSRALIASRGSSTEGLPKVNLKMELRDEADQDRDIGLLGMPADSDWVLYGPNVFDPIMTHNPLMYGLSRDLGWYSSRTRFVEVYLVQSGTGTVATTTYNGVYVLEEKIKRGAHRVDVDKIQPEHVREPEVSGGYLFKVDRPDPGDSGFTIRGQNFLYLEPKETDLRLPQWAAQKSYILNYFSKFTAALYGTGFRDPVNGYAAYFDVEQSIDYHLLNTVAFNVDALVLSTYLHKPRNGKLTFGPQWDFDRALGSTDGRDLNPKTWGANYFSAYWWSRLFADPDFTQRWIDRYQDLRLGLLSVSNLNARIDGLTGQLKQAQPRERAKWGTVYRGGTYASEITFSKTWLSNRLVFMDAQFLRRPTPVTAQVPAVPGTVALSLARPTNAAWVIYYTTNGTDPRLPGGAVSPDAIAYPSDGLPVFDRNVRVQARLYSTVLRVGTPNSRWSGPYRTTLVARRPVLRFSEVQYHPANPGGHEFIEVLNPSREPVELDGWSLAGGVRGALGGTNALRRLAPGDRCVLVADGTDTGWLPTGIRFGGTYAGKLSNAGEEIQLLGPVGETVDSVRIDPRDEPLADGGGWSLVVADEARMEVSRWRLSAHAGGSPGVADEATAPSEFEDTDRDGLPDPWERRMGLWVGSGAVDRGEGDRDSDGVTNAGEWAAGTNPNDAASRLVLEARPTGDGRVRLRWDRVPGRRVSVRVSESVGGPEQEWMSVPGRGTAGVEEWEDTAGASARFYRLSAP